MKKLVSAGVFLFVMFFLGEIQPCLCGNSSSGCIEGEREALLKLKRSFEDPSNRLVSWTGEDCCQWRGVSCSRDTGHVSKLDLRSTVTAYSVFNYYDGGGDSEYKWILQYNISEKLSASKVDPWLAKLKYLEYLDLSGNNFRKSRIPKFLGSLRNLRYLNISNTRFQGKIPDELGNLTSLQVLDLSSNDDSNELQVDSLRWASSLFSLQHLDMSWVDLRDALDTMTVLNVLPSLRHLSLSHCNIQDIHFSSGRFNSTFLETIQFLGLGGNNLVEKIPDFVHNMTALRELDLSGQLFLSVDNLQCLSSLSSLQYLDLSGVRMILTTDLIQVLNTLPSLRQLRLSYCSITFDNLSGSFNSTLLASIQVLDLSDNVLEGPVPDALCNMTSLRELDLSKNGFNSTLPLGLVTSQSLVHLDLSKNNFDSIEGGLSSLLNNACSLKSLDLSYNPFQGDVFGSEKNSSKCLMYDLEFLFLQYNGITGTIPDWLGKLKHLQYISLEGNSLHGSIPHSLGDLSQLRRLYLSYNRLLDGSIPQSLAKISTLEELYLSNNQLSGIIPEWPLRLQMLRILDLSHNRLSGTIPLSLGRLSSLEKLDLSHNQLKGTIPESLGGLSSLSKLCLSHNQLNGSVPESIGQLVKLETLDISSNFLGGTFSERNLANLSSLLELVISSNHLICKMRSDWMPPFSIRFIKMASCRIGPQFPQWIHTQKEISELDLSNANISGNLPILPQTIYNLDLSSNQISGSLPTDIAESMYFLNALFLGNNMLNGSIPNSLCQHQGMQVLDLSNNKLSGEIPNCWQSSQMLVVINLSSNKLSGTIPSSFGQLLPLTWLHLNDNSLRGELPPAFKNCTSLELLNLGNNKIFGDIPTWVGESLSALRILRLRKNMFSGTIPLQLCRLSRMQILDLALNNLSGGIPHCFWNLTRMTTKTNRSSLVKVGDEDDNDQIWDKVKVTVVIKGLILEYTTTLRLLYSMDLSSNKLVGTIPGEIGALSGLRNLNLSHNRLSGKIPNKIGGLESIESLDLSDNKLFGKIPSDMSKLMSLNNLNLSHNNLSGKIPTGNQLQTLNDPSIYAGNLQLCGAPLAKKCPGDVEPAKPPISSAHEDKDHDEDKNEKFWFYFVSALGYATGLWAVIGALVFKRNWRVAYFRFVDDTKELMLGSIEVKVARLKEKMERIIPGFGG